MKKWILIAALALTGCDEGRIYGDYLPDDRSGLSAHVEIVNALGVDRWFSGYSLAVAGFIPGSEYALISKNLELDDAGCCDVTLSGIPPEAQTIELCVVDRLRRRVAVFQSVRVGSDELSLICRGADLSPEAAIQSEIFNTTCINCHGGANFAAGNLNLTEGCAFQELVGQPSVKEPGRLRVAQGAPEESVLYQILSGNGSAAWSYDHSVEITASEKLDLIKNWIKAQ